LSSFSFNDVLLRCFPLVSSRFLYNLAVRPLPVRPHGDGSVWNRVASASSSCLADRRGQSQQLRPQYAMRRQHLPHLAMVFGPVETRTFSFGERLGLEAASQSTSAHRAARIGSTRNRHATLGNFVIRATFRAAFSNRLRNEASRSDTDSP